MKIRGLSDGQITDLVARSLWIFFGTMHEDGEYGYFSIQCSHSGKIILARCIGDCPDEKANQLFLTSLDRGQQLFLHKQDESSFQSRNPNALVSGQSENSAPWGHLAGAIRSHNLILSFAGTTSDLGDEAVMLFFSVQAHWLTQPQAYLIAGLSHNHLFENMMHSGASISV